MFDAIHPVSKAASVVFGIEKFSQMATSTADIANMFDTPSIENIFCTFMKTSFFWRLLKIPFMEDVVWSD